MDWEKVLYNGIETNIEVTATGRIRRVRRDWYGQSKYANSQKYGEIDLNKLKITKDGYYQITIQIKNRRQRSVLAQQLIAAAFLGYQFNGVLTVVDHIDSDGKNNKIENLRVVSNRENTSKEKTIKTGLPVGVSLYNTGKYHSTITIEYKTYHLGYHEKIEDASNAYVRALNDWECCKKYPNKKANKG